MAEPGMVMVIGVGVGLGRAQALRFAQGGHPVALVARKTEFTEPLADEINASGGKAAFFVADASEPKSVAKLFDDAEVALGPVTCVMVNASGRVNGTILELDPIGFESCWRAACFASFLVGQAAAKRMVPRGAGSIFFTGGQTSLEGKAGQAAYSVAKTGIRILSQSMARELGPQGIHVAHIQIDAGIDNPRTRERDPHLVDNDGLVSTEAAAEVFYQTHHQHRSCWSFDVEVRPYNKAF